LTAREGDVEPHPKFRTDITAAEHAEPGYKRTVVLKDPVSQKYFRLSPYEFQFLKALDGKLTLEEVIEKLKLRGRYYYKEYAESLVRRAGEMGLLLGTGFSSARFLGEKRKQISKARVQRRFSSVYFLFIPVWNPDRFLERTLWIFRAICNRWTAGIGAMLALGAVYIAASSFPDVSVEDFFFINWLNLLYFWITVALAKIIHEFSHAYAAKHFGLHVPQMGVAFLIFFPCLYCNTTDAWQLADRRERIAISAAGIIAEAALAVASTYIWYFSKPGVVNSIAFYLMAVSLVSTVLFNGNPLMKFDGYFILTDYIRTPNLAQKSWLYVRHLFLNRVLGLAAAVSPAADASEAALFGVYGASAFIYRFFLYTSIVMGVYYRFDKVIGAALAIAAFFLFLVRPIVKGAAGLYQKRASIHPSGKGTLVFLLICGAAAWLFVTPVSMKSVYPCYLDSQRIQKLTAPLETSIAQVYIREGALVASGAALFRLDSTRLRLLIANKRIERGIVDKEMELLLLDEKDRGKASGKLIEASQLDHEIAMLEKNMKLAQEGATAPFDAAVAKLDYRVQPGFHPGEGVVIGELKSRDDCVARALIPEEDVPMISPGQEVEIWFPVGAGKSFRATIDSVKPFSEKNLQDSPFSSRLGGEVATEQAEGGRYDAPLAPQYVASCLLGNSDGLPLGMTGRCVVSSPPRSVLSMLIRAAVSTFNRESLL
jgi:putative peptide zinc metalloprotease protein